MINVTDEMFEAALDAHDLDYDGQRSPDAIRAALVAALSIVMRDYHVSAFCNEVLAPEIVCKRQTPHAGKKHYAIAPAGSRVEW